MTYSVAVGFYFLLCITVLSVLFLRYMDLAHEEAKANNSNVNGGEFNNAINVDEVELQNSNYLDKRTNNPYECPDYVSDEIRLCVEDLMTSGFSDMCQVARLTYKCQLKGLLQCPLFDMGIRLALDECNKKLEQYGCHPLSSFETNR